LKGETPPKAGMRLVGRIPEGQKASALRRFRDGQKDKWRSLGKSKREAGDRGRTYLKGLKCLNFPGD